MTKLENGGIRLLNKNGVRWNKFGISVYVYIYICDYMCVCNLYVYIIVYIYIYANPKATAIYSWQKINHLVISCVQRWLGCKDVCWGQ